MKAQTELAGFVKYSTRRVLSGKNRINGWGMMNDRMSALRNGKLKFLNDGLLSLPTDDASGILLR